MKHFIYTLIQWSWGFIQTAVGGVMYLIYLKREHYAYHGACVTVWKYRSSVSLGKFIFLTEDPFAFYPNQRQYYSFEEFDEMLLIHEYGHTIQSLIFGPLYLVVIGLPSVLWGKLPVFNRKRVKEHRSYFSAYCERTANALGERVVKKKSIGQPYN